MLFHATSKLNIRYLGILNLSSGRTVPICSQGTHMITKNSIEVVILKCPYQNWKNPDVGLHLNNMFSLKLEGYQKEYKYGVLPFDTTDFVANHFLVYEKTSTGQTRLVSALKSTPYHYCGPFHLEFNGIAMLKHGNGKPEHFEEMNAIIDDCMAKSRKLAYYSSWTILPEVRKDKQCIALIKNVVSALTYLAHVDDGIHHLIGLGVPRFKTDQYFETWGFEPILHQGKPLSHLYIESYSDVEVIVMQLKEYSALIKEKANLFSDLWEDRTTVGNPLDLSRFEDDLKKKAA